MRNDPQAFASRLSDCELGSTSIMFGLMFTGMLSITGLAIDYSRAVQARSELQALADAAAIAGARLPATANLNRYEAAEKIFAENLLHSNLHGVRSRIVASNAEVRVEANYELDTLLAGLFGVDSINIDVLTAARSQVDNGGVTCLLSLSPDSDDGLHLQGINQAAADNCWAWVNSTSATAINADGASSATAQGFCTAGETQGAEHFAPSPYTGCQPMGDPFAERFASFAPDTSACKENNLSLKSGTYTLSPGVYCGNTVLKPHAHVTMEPGLYVFKDGYLEIQGQAELTGDGVTLAFVGDETKIIARGGGEIDLKAPTEGETAGFVVLKTDTDAPVKEAIIQGGGRVKLVGVLYAPSWRVNIGGNGEINQESEYFAMIADHFYMEGNGRLWINSDAEAAGMPEIMPKIKTGPVLTR